MEFASGEKYVKFFLLVLNFLKLVHSIINSVWCCFDQGTVSHKPGLPASVVTSHSSGKEASFSSLGHGLSHLPTLCSESPSLTSDSYLIARPLH